MKDKRVKYLLERIHSFPPLPNAVVKLFHIVEEPKTTIYDVSKIIENEPFLTARILRISNSSFYALSRTISTIPQAITILGFHAIKSLAIGLSVHSQININIPGSSLDIKDFWKHSLAVAVSARQIAVRMGFNNPEDVFVSGLLHDIGKMILMRYFNDEYIKAIETAATSESPLYEVENSIFEINHPLVAGELCKHWKMPDFLGNIVKNHHSSLENISLNEHDAAGINIIKIADNIAKIAQVGFSGDSNIDTNLYQVINKNNISIEQIRQIILTLPQEVQKVEDFFELEERNYPKNNIQKSLNVGVCISNNEEKETISLLILALGHTPVYGEQIKSGKTQLDFAITDESKPQQLKDFIIKENISIIDYSKWKTVNKRSINIQKLNEWLSSNLS